MPNIHAVILAGGLGSRLGGEVPKQFLSLGGKPVIAWSLEVFSSLEAIAGLTVTAPEAFIEETRRAVEKAGIAKPVAVITGGATRQGSVWNALLAGHFADDDIVLFHDAARPFVSTECINRCVDAARQHGAAGVYIPATDTIAEADDGFISAIPPRDRLYAAQTPQGFRYGTIRAAHERARSAGIFDATDDVRLVMDAGYRVKVVEGDRRNFKITTEEDLRTAELLVG